MTRVEDLDGAAVFKQAVFVPPGYSSLLFANLYEPSRCRQLTSLFKDFKLWLHKRLQLLESVDRQHLRVIPCLKLNDQVIQNLRAKDAKLLLQLGGQMH